MNDELPSYENVEALVHSYQVKQKHSSADAWIKS